MNFGELETEVNRLIQKVDDVFWTSAEIQSLINRGQSDLVERTGYLRETSTHAIAADTATLAMPDDLLELRRVWWDERALDLTSAPELDAEVWSWKTMDGDPTHYLFDGHTAIRFWMTPNRAGTVELEYTRTPLALTLSTDVPEVPRRYHQALCYYAAYMALDKVNEDREIQRALRYRELYLEEVLRAQDESSNEFSTAERVVPYRHL